MADYEYYEDYADIENIETPAAARSRRDADNSVAAGEFITYEICVRLVAEISATVLAPPTPAVCASTCLLWLFHSLFFCAVTASTETSQEWPSRISHF